MFTFFVFSPGWNIAKAKILQGADFGCPLVECLLRDGAHWHQKDAKVSERGKGVVLHGRASERRSHEVETKSNRVTYKYFTSCPNSIWYSTANLLCELATTRLTSQYCGLFQTKHGYYAT
jgi:hypothetical protein